MISVRNQLESIATALSCAPSSERVVIQSPVFKVSHASNFLQWMPDLYPFPEQYRQENRATIEYFRTIFGGRRIKDVSDDFSLGLDLDYKMRWGLPITKLDVEKLFVSMAIVKRRDLEDFVTSLFSHNNESGYLHLSLLEVKTLQEKFKGKKFETLDNAELKELYHQMIPFEKIETIFFHCIPTTEFSNGCDIKINFEHLKAFVHFFETTRYVIRKEYDLCEDPISRKKLKFFYEMRKLQKLISFNHPDGLVFYEPKGLRYVFGRSQAAGAFAILMKAFIPHPDKRFHSQICFLPTQGINNIPHRWESFADDAREEIGSTGAIEILPDLHLYFNRIAAGFRTEDEKIDFCGYSLGGNQAARMAIAFYPSGCVRKVFAVKLPYLDQASVEHLNKLVTKTPLKIHLVTDNDDHTSLYGVKAPGYGSRNPLLKVHYTFFAHKPGAIAFSYRVYDKVESLRAFPKRPTCHSNSITILGKFIGSLASAHPRETFSLKDYEAHEIRNYVKLGQEIEATSLLKIQEFMDSALLDNSHLGWEMARLHFIRGVLGLFGIATNRGQFVAFAELEESKLSAEGERFQAV